MTPGARVAAAIGILDAVVSGQAAEQALTRWARASRYAGSKDRAAVRDHVFDVVRQWRSAAAVGGDENGRALMLGLLSLQGIDAETLFTGAGHAPAPVTELDVLHSLPQQEGVRWNVPDWLLPEFRRSLGDMAEETATLLGRRAPVTLRVNTRLSSPASAIEALADSGISATPNAVTPTALRVTEGARRLRNSAAYLSGLVELQDAASQAVVASLPEGETVLDYCAGGGGKALAIAADPGRRVSAHDKDPRRMQDLKARAKRAQAQIRELTTAEAGQAAPFDIVFCDVPCSGSGAWRRTPEGRWSLTPQRLTELSALQLDILDKATDLTAPQGWIVYATCSLFCCENEDVIAEFVKRNPGWTCTWSRRFDVSEQSDGFYTAHLTRS